jgi:anti-sigma regulatory factor (Ser/Thr protein kinase)
VNAGPERLTITPDLSELGRVTEWADGLAAQMGLPGPTVFAIQLCFEEAVSNIIRHGRLDQVRGNKEVHLALERCDGTVIATIADHGVAFDPRTVPPPRHAANLDEAMVGGQGVNLMRKFASGMEYERRGDMNRLVLRFVLPERAG